MVDRRTAFHLAPAALAALALVGASVHPFGAETKKPHAADPSNVIAQMSVVALRAPVGECEAYARDHQACLNALSAQRRKGSEGMLRLRMQQFEGIRRALSTPQAREGLAAVPRRERHRSKG